MDAINAKELLFSLAKVLRWLATPWGLAAMVAGLSALFLFRVWNAARTRQLACAAAGQRFRATEAAGLFFKEIYSASLGIVAALPVIVGVLATALSLLALSDTLEGLDRMRADAQRIRELGQVLRNLEGRQRVMDVRVMSVKDGTSTLRLSFLDTAGKEAQTQTLTIAGTDIYVDAIVCNFDYAQIAEGRKVNLAIPYRVFSDKVAQADGVALGGRTDGGIPLQYERPAEAIYGIAPELYRERLAELVAILDKEDTAREAGIVRSLYGSAVHKVVKQGDSFSLWVEQSGGLTIKDTRQF